MKLNYPIFRWFLIGVAFWGILALAAYGAYTLITSHSLPIEAKTQGNPAPMPSFTEIQQMLVDRGHNIKVDGKICKGWNCPEHSETLTAWGKEIGNDYYKKTIARMARDRK